MYGRIGVDRDGLREDWALVNVTPERRGQNGSWCDVGELELSAELVGGPDQRGAFGGGVLGVKDPGQNGLIWAKDEATTGWTVGSCNGILAEIFLKCTTQEVLEDAGPEDVHRGNVCMGKALTSCLPRGPHLLLVGTAEPGFSLLTRVAWEWCLVGWLCPLLFGTVATQHSRS